VDIEYKKKRVDSMINIKEVLDKQRKFFSSSQTKDLDFRITQLKKLHSIILKYEKDILTALKADLNKSEYEAYMTEIGFTLEEITTLIKGLRKWAKPKKVKTPLTQFPAKSYIYSEPYGICLIISPWNYPFQLTLAPLAGAIAGGNCAVVKPSNYSTNTSKLINKLISENFNEKYIKVVEGGREENQNLLEQKFDYIFFTGSVNVGKVVMEAASKHLTPVSLELGGKSPCIVDETANLKLAAKRIVWGKFLNSGQTCVAPDYLLVQDKVKEELISYLITYTKELFEVDDFPNPNFPKIINKHHYQRLLGLIENENIIIGGKGYSETNQIEPTILDNVSWDSKVMGEEIFGPILPIITFDTLEEVIEKVNERPKPLALYYFTTLSKNEQLIINSISHGGGCINDTIVHLASSYLPFGGVGNSGMGSYHGKASFDTFTHKKSIMKRSNKLDIALRYPPFNRSTKILKRFMK
jgi:aldehyde dehydrogenase (NAD+)